MNHLTTFLLLNGIPIENIPYIDKSSNFYNFDYKLIRHYNIDEKLIPSNSVLINKEVSYFEEHRELVLGSLGVLVFLAIISILLGLDNLKHRTMQYIY